MMLCTCPCHAAATECPSCQSRWAHECRSKPAPDFPIADARDQPRFPVAPPTGSLDPNQSAQRLRAIIAQMHGSPAVVTLKAIDKLALLAGIAALERELNHRPDRADHESR